MTGQNKKLQTLLEKSGIPTHLKAIDILKSKHWPIIVSPYYYDDIYKSAREIDIIAEKVFTDEGLSDFGRRGAVAIQLFIECKYINQEIIFWFDKFNKGQAILKLEKETGLRIAYNKPGGYDIPWNHFHYLHQEKVAKLFSPNINNEDIIYKAISQSLTAQRFYALSNRLIFKKENHFAYQDITKTVRYPIVLCDNFENLFEIKKEDASYTYPKIPSSFLIEAYYTFEKNAQADYVLIDVVDINRLDDFLKNLEAEAMSITKSYQMKSG